MPESTTVPAPVIAEQVFGDRLAVAQRYVEFLAEQGVMRGVIGPREVDRLWQRHLVNSAAIAELIPTGADVVDLGSGAGLPGIPLAIARSDLELTLLEPMARRVDWLLDVVRLLELPTRVVRGRAEESGVGVRQAGADVVVARAVAPLHRLARWALPLLRPGGTLLALKGSSVAEEVARDADSVRRSGGGRPRVVGCAVAGEQVATIAVVERDAERGHERRSRKDR